MPAEEEVVERDFVQRLLVGVAIGKRVTHLESAAAYEYQVGGSASATGEIYQYVNHRRNPKHQNSFLIDGKRKAPPTCGSGHPRNINLIHLLICL